MGEEGIVSGGVFEHGTHEEDGPGTWEAVTLVARLRAQARPAKNKRPQASRIGSFPVPASGGPGVWIR